MVTINEQLWQLPEWQSRTNMLLGSELLKELSSCSVAVIGLGGVGAYAAEMLARVGVGSLVILDCDVVAPSNINRQLLALNSTIALSKVSLMEQRLKDINPDLKITTIEDYLNEESVGQLLDGVEVDCIVDAIDTLSPKIALIQYSLKRGVPIVSSMGAGAKRDATKVRISDLSKSYNCPLAYMLRKRLRKLGISKGFKVVFSEELPDTTAIVQVEEKNKKSQVGTISYMPAVFGCVVAQAVVDELIAKIITKQDRD